MTETEHVVRQSLSAANPENIYVLLTESAQRKSNASRISNGERALSATECLIRQKKINGIL